MKKPDCWNHNTAYYGWVKRQTAHCSSILDVGCGDGALEAYLDDGRKRIVGLDSSESCIAAAKKRALSEGVEFRCADFASFRPEQRFDAAVFVASLHHMDAGQAVTRAKALLSPGGVLLIVGLAKPSGAADWLLEALRVVPAAVMTRLRKAVNSEDRGIPVSYELPAMSSIRALPGLAGAKLRYGLYYRYLLTWKKPETESEV